MQEGSHRSEKPTHGNYCVAPFTAVRQKPTQQQSLSTAKNEYVKFSLQKGLGVAEDLGPEQCSERLRRVWETLSEKQAGLLPWELPDTKAGNPHKPSEESLLPARPPYPKLPADSIADHICNKGWQ